MSRCGFCNGGRFFKAVAEANENRFAQGGPSVRALIPYVDAAEMKRLLDRHTAARAKLVPPAGAEPGNVQAWRPAIVAPGDVVAAESGIIARRSRPPAAGDRCARRNRRNPRGQCGRKRGQEVFISHSSSENADVVRLAKEINNRRDAEVSQNDIALQFTEGDEKKAQNLLRQLRRYPHLIRKLKR